MRLLVLSDTHLGKPKWGDFGAQVFEQAKAIARSNTIDVVIHGGDIVEPGGEVSLIEGLARVREIPAAHHLWVIGNNDIEALRPGPELGFTFHTQLAEIAQQQGVRTLDTGFFTVGDVGFVGGFGGYGLSLWRPEAPPDPEYPTRIEELVTKANREFYRPYLGCGIREWFRSCQDRLQQHLLDAAGCEKLVVFTHTVPTPEMVIYGQSAKYDWQNAFMGWDDSRNPLAIERLPNLVLQLCGHTHRHQRIDRPGRAPLVNVSGAGQPHIFEVG